MSARSVSLRALDLVDEAQHTLREPVDVGPAAITHAVPAGSNVDHVGVPGHRLWHPLVRLLVGDDDQPVVRQCIDPAHGGAEVGAAVVLRPHNRVDTRYAPPWRDVDEMAPQPDQA